jgi:hypothetical protein
MRVCRRNFLAGVFGAVSTLLAALPACRSARGDSGPEPDAKEPLVTEVTFVTGARVNEEGNLVLATKRIECPPGTRAKLIFE